MSDTPIDVISDTTAEAIIETTVSDAGDASEAATDEAGKADEAATDEPSEAEAAINLPVEYILDSIQVDHPVRAAVREELRAQIDPLREQLEALVKLLVR